MCSLLRNDLHAVADSGERVWCILVYLRAVFVATPTGEVSEVEIFLRFDGVPELALSSVFARTCSKQSVFFRVHPLSVHGLTFTCMRGSVIFNNMLDFAYDYVHCVPSRRLRRIDKPLVGASLPSRFNGRFFSLLASGSEPTSFQRPIFIRIYN